MIESTIINNKKIYAFQSKDQFLEFISYKHKILIALNAEKLDKKDKDLNEIINNNIGYSDGIGAVLALKRKGLKSIKIAGAEFWLDIVKKYSESKSFYLIGSSELVIQNTVMKLKENFPNINIVGYRNGYLNSEDYITILHDFKKKKPDVVFVGMGSPKQEFLMKDFLSEYPAIYMGLGGSFDVYSNLKKRAPKIFIKLGLEWFYRLLKEPIRVKRQVSLLKFGCKILLKKI